MNPELNDKEFPANKAKNKKTVMMIFLTDIFPPRIFHCNLKWKYSICKTNFSSFVEDFCSILKLELYNSFIFNEIRLFFKRVISRIVEIKGGPYLMRSDLLSIFRTLSSEEINQLRKFFQSRYFSNNKNAELLFEEFCKYYPLFEINEPDKLKIYRNIYGDIPFNDSTFRSLIHFVIQLIEDYLSVQYFRRNTIEKDFAVLEELKFRNNDDLYLKRLERMKRSLPDELTFFSVYNLQNRIKLNDLILNNSILNESVIHKDTLDVQMSKIRKTNDYNALEYFIECINNYTVYEVFMKTCDISNSEQTDLDLHFPDFESLKNSFKDNVVLVSIIELYQLLYKVYNEFGNEKHFIDYKSMFKDCRVYMDTDEIKKHYLKIVSYLIIKKNNAADNKKYKLELWNMYSEMLKSDLLIERNNPYLDINLYRSILFLGLSLKLYDEVRNFIDAYSKKVNPGNFRNILHLSYGNLYYELSDYEKALESATKIKISDFVFKYDTKNLLIKIYFEMGYWENLTSTINTYKEFLRNDPVLNREMKTKFRLFISHLEYLILHASKKDKTDVSFHLKKLQSEDVYNKDWLIKKYSEYLSHKIEKVNIK